jgi:hypothetical protein
MSETGERSARDLGKAHMQGGRFIQAAEALRSAVEKDPADEMAWRLLGGALASLGENQASVDAFTEARNLAPNSAKSHYNLALALQAAGQNDEARASLEKSLEIDPAYLQARSKLNEMLGIENTDEMIHAPTPEPAPASVSASASSDSAPPLNTPPTPPTSPTPASASDHAGMQPVGGMQAVGGGMQAVGGGQAQQHGQAQAQASTNEPPSAYAPLAPPPSYSAPSPYAPAPQVGRSDYSAPAPAVNGTLILALGLVGLLTACAPCGIAAWIMGNGAMATLDQYPNSDQSQRGTVNAGRIVGIISTILWVLAAIGWLILFVIVGQSPSPR